MARLAILSRMRKSAAARLPNTCTINPLKDHTLFAIGIWFFR
ncbi:MAG TPA: hypothetical protein VHD33_01420 [Legionellaceae bacterium]|nr:hypothetical protein [Legionellaceae bacterium]